MTWTCLEETHYRDTLHPDFIGTVQNKDTFFLLTPWITTFFEERRKSVPAVCSKSQQLWTEWGWNKENILWWLNPWPMKTISCICHAFTCVHFGLYRLSYIVLTSGDFKTGHFHRRLHASLSRSALRMKQLWINRLNISGCLWSGADGRRRLVQDGVIRDPLVGTLQESPPPLSRLFQEVESSRCFSWPPLCF